MPYHCTYCKHIIANVWHMLIFLTSSCNCNHAWILKNTISWKEWVLLNSYVGPTNTSQRAESLLGAVGQLHNEHKWEHVLYDCHQEFHDQMLSTCTCPLAFSCKCNRVIQTIRYKSSITATESIVVVIVRIEANYRSAHVWPPYAYNFTYSYMYWVPMYIIFS